eukprot:12705475-Prorocentrum_lima.AAC.1
MCRELAGCIRRWLTYFRPPHHALDVFHPRLSAGLGWTASSSHTPAAPQPAVHMDARECSRDAQA